VGGTTRGHDGDNVTREIPNPITAIVNGVSRLGLFMWLATGAAVRKLLSPERWDYGEQIRRAPDDARKAVRITPTVLRNAFENAAEFFQIRDRGNDGPRE
jgi:hypothetical protein